MWLTFEGTLPEPAPDDSTSILQTIPEPGTETFEPVGRWYESYCVRRHRKHTLSASSLTSSSSEEDEDEESEFDEEDEELLMTLDPKEWKHQDHYAVLGIKKLRWKATDDQIKRAYKKKVLNHHPDKRRARGIPVKDGEEDYFTCITRAYETLGNPTKRRSFDSVDPEFDDTIPSSCNESKEKFFEVFGPVFERNARWSTSKKAVPLLGDENSSFDDVNYFYSFWYDFESWREYSYLDEEEKEKGENREERRWIERQNKAERQKRKKEEISRIRQLVDNAYACDMRIAKFKEEEKAKKQAIKQAKKDAARARAEEEEKKRQAALEEERKKKEQEEEEARLQAAAAKKEKDAQKKVMKKERKTLRTIVKDYDFFATNEDERVRNMAEVDKLAELLSMTSLQELNRDLTSGDREKAKASFLKEVDELEKRLEREKQELLETAQKSSAKGGSNATKGPKGSWSDEEVQALIKAVNLFPAGTASRWDVIANFLRQHVEGSDRTGKEVLAKAKDLQKNDQVLKQDANKKAFDKFAKDTQKTPAAAETSEISQRFDSAGVLQMAETGSNPAPWSAEEQKLLEQALKTYPASTQDRWDRIADCLPARSKKDCMKRYKELVEMVRAKKAAQVATAKK